MPPERLYLSDGVSVAQAVASLTDCIREAQNPASWGSPGDVFKLVSRYLQWFETAESRLASLTCDAEALTMLQTERHWYIRRCGASIADARPWPLVEAEVEAQRRAFDRLLQDLKTRAGRLASAPGHITVVDTNLLLHFHPPDQIPWPELLGRDLVRLVVPLRVVEELDAKKYARRNDLADRARRLLSKLETTVGPEGAPGKLRGGVTIEVPVDPGPRRRPVDADQEILDTCRELRQLTSGEVTLVTGDTTMRLRAQACGTHVARLPARFERDQRQAESAAAAE